MKYIYTWSLQLLLEDEVYVRWVIQVLLKDEVYICIHSSKQTGIFLVNLFLIKSIYLI